MLYKHVHSWDYFIRTAITHWKNAGNYSCKGIFIYQQSLGWKWDQEHKEAEALSLAEERITWQNQEHIKGKISCNLCLQFLIMIDSHAKQESTF
jgi:hypothetical protein